MTVTAALAQRAPPRAAWWGLALLGMMCALPFVQWRHTHPVTSFYSEWLAFVLGAAALAPLMLRRYASPLAVPAVTLLPLALAAVAIVHLLLVRSAYPQQPLFAAIYLAWAAGLVLVAAAVRRELGLERVCAVLAAFVLAGGLLNTAAGVLQHYEWRGPLEAVVATKLGYQVYGNLGQPNHFATHVALALVSLGYLFSTRRAALPWTFLAAAPMLFVLALSGSRSTGVYLAVLAVLAVLRYVLHRTGESRRAMLFVLALLPGLGLAHVIAELPWFAPPTLHTTAVDRVFSLASSSSERLQLWREAWAMFTGAPLGGVGWGQFAWHHFMMTGEEGRALEGLYNHAHNLVLHLLAETGIIGGAIALGGLVLWMHGARRVAAEPAGLWLWGCALVLGVHSMLEYPLWNAYFLGIASVVLGLGDGHTLALKRSALVRGGAAVFICATVGFGTLLLDSYYRLERVVGAQYQHDDRRRLAQAHEDMRRVSATFFLAPYVDLAYARDIDLINVLVRTKREFTERVMHFAPTGLVAYRYAALCAIAGDRQTAAWVLRQASRAYPQLIDGFAREFASTFTGDPEAEAWFAAEMERVSKARKGGGPPQRGDENRHFLPRAGGTM